MSVLIYMYLISVFRVLAFSKLENGIFNVKPSNLFVNIRYFTNMLILLTYFTLKVTSVAVSS